MAEPGELVWRRRRARHLCDMAAGGRGLGFLGMARCWVKKNGSVAKENDWHTKTDVAKTKHARSGNALKIAESHQLAAKNRSRTNCHKFRKVNNYNVFIVWTLRAIPVLVELPWLSISACSATRALDFDVNWSIGKCRPRCFERALRREREKGDTLWSLVNLPSAFVTRCPSTYIPVRRF